MNILEIQFRHRLVKAVADKHYRVLISLIRSDRPRYWNFRCMNCGSNIVEIHGMEVVSAIDFFDPENINNAGIGRKCKGNMPDGLPCPYKYFFNVQ